jgi:hypothetical protein
MAEARLGMKLVEQDFVQETIAGSTYWSGPTRPPTPHPGPYAYLLPPFDEFTVAYKDRSAFLDPTLAEEALYGIGPSIIIDGRMTGTWKRTLKKDEVLIKISPLAPLIAGQEAAISAAAKRYGKFLNLRPVLE